MATARAGNVIGGGDWAKDRIVPDCVRAWSQGKKAVIRSPQATRPWQHVLEPLSGYLWLGACLLQGQTKIIGESFNFGPRQRASKTVGQLADLFVFLWEGACWEHVPAVGKKKEALLLQLSPRKTQQMLAWSAALTFRETVTFTALWYRQYYAGRKNMFDLSCAQIDAYIQKARDNGACWAGKGDL